MAGPSTLDQRRAAHAWDAVEKVVQKYPPTITKVDGKEKKQPHEKARKYGIHSKKLPSRIMAAGLGQSLAFLLAKDYCPDLLQALSHWVLNKKEYPPSADKLPAADALLKAVIGGDSDTLRLHTAEALAYLQWLVRFVEAQGLGGEDQP